MRTNIEGHGGALSLAGQPLFYKKWLDSLHLLVMSLVKDPSPQADPNIYSHFFSALITVQSY